MFGKEEFRLKIIRFNFLIKYIYIYSYIYLPTRFKSNVQYENGPRVKNPRPSTLSHFLLAQHTQCTHTFTYFHSRGSEELMKKGNK